MNNRPVLRMAQVLGQVVIAVAAALSGRADSTPVPSQQEPVSFHRQVRPILQANCAGCHQPAKAKGGYVLTEFSRLMTPGDSEKPPIVPGKPGESYLIAQITPTDGKAEMPSGKDPLHSTEIELIARWIAEGAKDDTPATASRRYDADHPPRYSRPPVITALDYSPDGTLLAVAGFHEVLLHRSDGSGLEARLIGMSERIQSVRFSPDGKLLAAAGGQPARMGEVQIWDVEKRQLKLSVPVGYDTVYGVSWSPDGRLVAFGCPDKTVRAIDASTGKQVLQQMAHEDWVLDTVFSTDGSHVISVGRDMTTKLTEVATQRFVDNITSITPGALRGGLQSVARHPSRDEVLVGGSDGQPQIYQVFRQAARKIGDNAALLRKFPQMSGRIFSVAYSPDGNLIAAAAALDGRGAINLYAAKFDPAIPDVLLEAYKKTSGEYTKEEREAIEAFTTADVKLLHHLAVPTAPVYAVSFSPDGQRIAAATGSGVVLVHDVETGELQMVFAAAPHDAFTDPTEAQLAELAAASATEPQTAFESLPKDLRVTDLEIQPASVTLKSRNERVQLLVTATLASGGHVDVTRMVRFESPSAGSFDLAISPRGVLSVRPARTSAPDAPLSGKQTVVAHLDGHRAELEVEIDLAHSRFDADFIQDINPVLSKLGCNAGTCHGAREGKNGFKLSLRGYDPIFDVRSMTDDLAARRVNLASPDESLMLLKATAAVPHEGGQRTTRDSDDYAILRQWIADGARLEPKSPRVVRITLSPANPVVQNIGASQQVRVIATYADGRTRDVTTHAFIESGNTDVATADATGLLTTHRRGEAPILARFEGSYAATTLTVMGDRSGFEWAEFEANNRIDELVAAKWQRMKILPSDLCSDAEFIRRVSLDLTGLPPTAQQVREFLENPRDQRSKRDALIERLLNSPEFVDHWANKWADLLQVNRKFLGVEGAKLFHDWIRQQIERNTPYDEFVRRIITASGSNREHPAASYWKILRDPTEAMETTTHLFLATRFNCNKCHDHPFERWTQDQYYELAQYFAQVQFRKDDASGDRRIGGTAVEGAKPLFEIVSDGDEGGVRHDRTGEYPEPEFPFPVDFDLAVTDGKQPSRREELAAWLTSPNNPYFAMSYVNRLWGYLLGVGLIEPLDDIRAGNPPSNPELLNHLTREFIESGFNTRHILRQICQSRVYQLSIDTHRWNADDQINYSHAMARRLPAEVLLDSVYRVTGATPNFPGAKPGTRAAQLLDPGVDLPSGFLANLGRPPRESACECERSNDIKLSSVMSLLSGPAISDAIQDPENALARLVSRDIDDNQLADELFLRILNRPPRDEERTAFSEYTAHLEREHERLRKALAEAEAEWAVREPQLQRQRAQAVALAENALAAHLVQTAASAAAAQRERLEKIAAAQSMVDAYEPQLHQRLAEWEASLGSNQKATRWIPLDPKNLSVGGSARLRKLPDGSVLSTPSVGELPNFVVTAETTITGITGIKLEVLPHADLPNFGPGHKDGDFFLAEFIVEYASRTNAEKFARATIQNAAADHVARDLSIEQTFNGIREQGRLDGWNIGDQTGRPHWATFALEKPVGDTNGTVLKFNLIHAYEAPYEIGRFRLWVTTSPEPIQEGLPADLVPILDVPAHRRTPEQTEKLLAYIRSRDPAMLKRDFELELARKPLPEDQRLKELERDLARASRPVPIDPVLLQLRQDVELSERQLAKRRLTAAQDLAWALINTPAFLFNH